MCTRINQFISPGQIQSWFDVASDRIPSYPALYNNPINTADPQILTVRQGDHGRVTEVRRWGLLPSWAESPKDPKVQATFNCKVETMKEKPSFSLAWKRGQRCIIPVAGIYEWPKPSWGPGTPARFIYRRDETPLLIAGLWYDWHRLDQSLPTFTMNTTTPNRVLKSIPHDRMVCFLDPKDIDVWLDPENQKADDLLKPCPDQWLTHYVTTGYVNNWRHQGPQCIEKGPPGSELPPEPKEKRTRKKAE